jgi:hypothetical protein
MAKRKLENGEQRPAPETYPARAEIPKIADQRPAPARARGPVSRWAQGVGRWVQVAATAPRSNMAYPGQQSEEIQSDRLQPTCSVANQRETLRNAAREGWNPVPLPPPTRPRPKFSVALKARKNPNKHGSSHVNLRTATQQRRPKILSLRPFFSKPPDFANLVQNL